MALLLGKNETLLMIGDSITDAGRVRPVGTRAKGLGVGYVSLVDALLTAVHPELSITVLNTGISGNTVRDLASRWQTDVLHLAPDWLSIMIGTNDVWRQFDTPDDPNAGVFEEEYTGELARLVESTKPLVKGVVLLTPFLVETSMEDPMRRRMDEYSAIVASIASDTGVYFGNTQAAFDNALLSVPAQSLAPDRIHPSLPGHAVLAKTFLDAVGFEW